MKTKRFFRVVPVLLALCLSAAHQYPRPCEGADAENIASEKSADTPYPEFEQAVSATLDQERSGVAALTEELSHQDCQTYCLRNGTSPSPFRRWMFIWIRGQTEVRGRRSETGDRLSFSVGDWG